MKPIEAVVNITNIREIFTKLSQIVCLVKTHNLLRMTFCQNKLSGTKGRISVYKANI